MLDREAPLRIVRAHGVAVHAGARKRRHIALRDDVAGEHAAVRFAEHDGFDVHDWRAGGVED